MSEGEERFDHIDSIFERMQGSARMRVVDQRLLDVKTPEDLDEARAFVNQIIDQKLVSAAELVKRTGIKGSAISGFRTGNWKGAQGTLYTTASELVKAIDQFLKQQEDDARRADIAAYVPTQFAEAVNALVQQARTRRVMGAFVAPAGQGKTMVLTAIREETPGAVLITITQRRSSPKSFLQIWCRALGLSEKGRAEDLQDRVCQCLYKSDRLQLVDEAHKAPHNTLDIIREVWDATKVPIVIAGTPSFYATLTTRQVGSVATELMDQLFSRVGIYADFTTLEGSSGEPEPLNSIECIRKLFSRGKVRLRKDAEDLLGRLSNLPGRGGLRLCRTLVDMVVSFWPERSGSIGQPELYQCLCMRQGKREADHLIELANSSTSKPRAAVAAG